jgi:3,4-dihydroxy-9,10-secoandrosta-1,3,5(10)-triene-9,17-dione 4,5-dioxygenase
MSRIQALAYVVADAVDPSRWRQFGERVLGTMSSDAPQDGAYLKLDERAYRIAVHKAEADRYFASGWEVPDARAFEQTLDDLSRAGVNVEPGGESLRRSRQVERFATFLDPSGNRHELVQGYVGARSGFSSPLGVAGFKTSSGAVDLGVGHTVLPALQFDATLALFRDTLGFGLSDVFNFRPAPEAPNMRIYFLHAASGRHHSLALAEMPNPAGCVHMMVEVNSMTDVGRAHDRRERAGVKLIATLGEHENDRMTSFYMMTPGHFAIEYGWGGLIVDPASWRATETRQVSVWGHDFSVGLP